MTGEEWRLKWGSQDNREKKWMREVMTMTRGGKRVNEMKRGNGRGLMNMNGEERGYGDV